MFGMIGRDWTHPGVAKLYTDIAANGYHLLYLTSRSVGQADMTRAYLDGINQDGHRLPKGPVILSPDRTIAALRREIYLRKPEVFKMSFLNDILGLFRHHQPPTNPQNGSPEGAVEAPGVFYAGFGNRATDALSYRAVHIPPTRIFTINSQAEVSIDVLAMGAYRSSYVSMRELVDHFFPPVGLLVRGGGAAFTDFSYWRDRPLAAEDFSDSESESEGPGERVGRGWAKAAERSERASLRSEDERGEDEDEEDEDEEDPLAESILSADLADSSILESIEGEEDLSRMVSREEAGTGEGERNEVASQVLSTSFNTGTVVGLQDRLDCGSP